MIENLIIGILVGSFLVGTSVQRTLTVGTGEFAKTFISSCINSIFYFLTVYFISKECDRDWETAAYKYSYN